MKKQALNFIAVLGFILLGSAVVLGILTGVLFMFPNVSIFGAKAVNERDTQIVYLDEDLADAFANGKFILESNGTNIEVKVSSASYEGNGTIVVNESATGIAFNSLNRTLIQWTKTLYGEDKELFYRIKILEPSGMVFSNQPTTVYINLPHRDDNFKYDFILQNKYSPVNFSYVNDTETNTDKLLIDDLIVESAASVTIPYAKDSSVDDVVIAESVNHTKFSCQAQVGNVLVKGTNNTLDFGSDQTGITGNVTITGENNRFNGTSANQVKLDAKNGNLHMSGTIGTLEVNTSRVSVDVEEVSGTVKMDTVSGDLDAGSIKGDLTFNAGTADTPNATARLHVGKLAGATKVRNYGVGEISLSGVNGSVDIISKEINGGAINVDMADGASGHKVDVLGYDGNINVTGINGGNVTLEVLGGHDRAAFANIKAQFNKVGTAKITSGAYLAGHDEIGNIEVSVGDACNNFDVYVFNARFANCAQKYRVAKLNVSKNKEDTTSAKNEITFDAYSVEGRGSMVIDSQNRVTLA
ncbi:MAG: hypothetical protein KIG16_01365 [Eubacteriales bacterium]|nr:hypothetical protein [Eubacteriales bacterium]